MAILATPYLPRIYTSLHTFRETDYIAPLYFLRQQIQSILAYISHHFCAAELLQLLAAEHVFSYSHPCRLFLLAPDVFIDQDLFIVRRKTIQADRPGQRPCQMDPASPVENPFLRCHHSSHHFLQMIDPANLAKNELIIYIYLYKERCRRMYSFWSDWRARRLSRFTRIRKICYVPHCSIIASRGIRQRPGREEDLKACAEAPQAFVDWARPAKKTKATNYHTSPNLTLLCHALLYHAMHHLTYHTSPCHAMSQHALPHLAMPHFTIT